MSKACTDKLWILGDTREGFGCFLGGLSWSADCEATGSMNTVPVVSTEPVQDREETVA